MPAGRYRGPLDQDKQDDLATPVLGTRPLRYPGFLSTCRCACHVEGIPMAAASCQFLSGPRQEALTVRSLTTTKVADDGD